MALPKPSIIKQWGNQPRYGEYDIVGAREGKPMLLGAGSFGKTFQGVRVEHIAGSVIEETVAIKVLNPEMLGSDEKRAQFIQELVALTKFKHSNLIHYIRCGEENGEVYYAMELCRGGDLEQLVRRFGPLPERVVALIAYQVVNGLREVHLRHRFVHRDIKPSNIMLVDELESDLTIQHLGFRIEEQDSLCRIVDFGLVDFTLNTQDVRQRFVGSPMFASPEQIREQPVDGRSDLYSLGMTLWYLLQGNGPLLDANGNDLNDLRGAMARHTEDAEFDRELPPNLTPEFREILIKMVAKRPEKRFDGAGEALAALRDYLSGAVREKPQFALTRLEQPVESAFLVDSVISNHAGRKSYAVRDRNTGQSFKLAVFATLQGDEDPQAVESIARRLTDTAKLTMQPAFPASILPVHEVIWAADALGYTEELIPHATLADVLRARANAKRPIGFSEACVLLRPIAEGLDFLLRNERDAVVLASEEIWLASPNAANATENLLSAPLGEWEGLRVYFSMMFLPPGSAQELHGSNTSSQQTMSGSMQLSESDMHPVLSFARLVYRVLNGSEVATAVQFTPNAYVPAVTLGPGSNNLIRDILSGQKMPDDVTAVLKDLCDEEGVIWRSGASTTATSARSMAGTHSAGSSIRGGSLAGASRVGGTGAQGSAAKSIGSSASLHRTAVDSENPASRSTLKAPPAVATSLRAPSALKTAIPEPAPKPLEERPSDPSRSTPGRGVLILGLVILLVGAAAGTGIYLKFGKGRTQTRIPASTPEIAGSSTASQTATPAPSPVASLPESVQVDLQNLTLQPTFKIANHIVRGTQKDTVWTLPLRDAAPTLPFTIAVEATGYDTVEIPISTAADLQKPITRPIERSKGKLALPELPAEYNQASCQMIEVLPDEKDSISVETFSHGIELHAAMPPQELPTGVYRVNLKGHRAALRWPVLVTINKNATVTMKLPATVEGTYRGKGASKQDRTATVDFEIAIAVGQNAGSIQRGTEKQSLTNGTVRSGDFVAGIVPSSSDAGDASELSLVIHPKEDGAYEVYTATGDVSDTRNRNSIGTVQRQP